ncbi:MAG TPA: methylenetetrahydrofolate--tRNA-(uracil(54)-C(5))-methyltransferase (FADH(2)-oxidizing) TrmFO [Aggregatilineales bacterium]|nr:methylenetetrahydrofolate--tRNA-(uracil(54)-C(5))-methyltransferase (FADH(2)-oxidizing) TrmFO [Anaerolineales bacterium]HRE46171.1 methylenetetrahydrofolate--tRNA-(uracil(54)-C(5))-methyltransferase (FADH(2)-oxidizing) TrmFO [Aggregatilineales bacterium]
MPVLPELIVVGGGLAGTEAAYQAAQRGVRVTLYEMRPVKTTPAHRTGDLAELVCSNSLGSDLPDRAPGLLKNELRAFDSLLLRCAADASVPAGGALAVDREVFAAGVLAALETHPNITIRREEVLAIPTSPCVIASGPLTAETLAADIARLIGQEYLYFYDALSPIVALESIDLRIAFRASRYDRGSAEDGDYINCALTRGEYETFVDALLGAETYPLHDFEREDPKFFEGCLPIEQIAKRGRDSLAFGPMRPVGLCDPRTGKRPYAIVQLRQDNLSGSLYNIVGFQTNLKWGEQERVFRLIPGLENAEILRHGQMHRNTFINAPTLLRPTLQYKTRDDLFFAGQITGIEGYVGNIGTGLLAGINAARVLHGDAPLVLPPTTMLGALCHYVTHAVPDDFQPMKANYGILPPLANPPRGKRERAAAYTARAMDDLETLLKGLRTFV